jgi:hypothetical protein
MTEVEPRITRISEIRETRETCSFESAHENHVCRNLTLFLCGGADVQERLHIADEHGLNLRCSCSAPMRNNRFFCLISKSFNETHLTIATQAWENSPKE